MTHLMLNQLSGKHGEGTCYDFYDGSFAHRVFYESCNFTIIPSTEIETLNRDCGKKRLLSNCYEFKVTLGMCGITTTQARLIQLCWQQKIFRKRGDFSLKDVALIEKDVSEIDN